MDMFNNVTSNVTNWWGKKSDENPGSNNVSAPEGSDQSTAISADDAANPSLVKGTSLSPPTSDADSHTSNQSEVGADGDKAAVADGDSADPNKGFVPQMQTNITEVGSKAVSSAKNFGSFMYSLGNKVGKSVTDTASKIKTTVGENSMLSEFNKEQAAFVAGKKGEGLEPALAPWVGCNDEEMLKQQILSLSLERRNFMKNPPSGIESDFDYDKMYPVALAIIAEDPNLDKMRFELVPKHINEENFWRNYFYRVSLISQSSHLSSLAQESTGSDGDNDSDKSRDASFDRGVIMDSGDGGANPTSDEFVSDSYRRVPVDKDLQRGMQQLGMQGNNQEEWEKELAEELKEFEVVTTSDENTFNPAPTPSTASENNPLAPIISDEAWEQQYLQEMMDQTATPSATDPKQ